MGHEMAGEVLDGADGLAPPARRSRAGRSGALLRRLLRLPSRDAPTSARMARVIGREVNGGFADFVVAPRSHVYPLPPSIDSRTAPLIQVLTTVLHAQRASVDCQLANRSRWSGLGVSGQLHVQLAKAAGRGPRHRRHAQRVEAQHGRAARRRSHRVNRRRRAFRRSARRRTGMAPTSSSSPPGMVKSHRRRHRHGAAWRHRRAVRHLHRQRRGAAVLPAVLQGTDVISARAAMGEDFPESIDLVARGRITLDPLVTQVLPVSSFDACARTAGKRRRRPHENHPGKLMNDRDLPSTAARRLSSAEVVAPGRGRSGSPDQSRGLLLLGHRRTGQRPRTANADAAAGVRRRRRRLPDDGDGGGRAGRGRHGRVGRVRADAEADSGAAGGGQRRSARALSAEDQATIRAALLAIGMTEPQTSSNYIIPYRPAGFVTNAKRKGQRLGHQRQEAVHLERQPRAVLSAVRTDQSGQGTQRRQHVFSDRARDARASPPGTSKTRWANGSPTTPS